MTGWVLIAMVGTGLVALWSLPQRGLHRLGSRPTAPAVATEGAHHRWGYAVAGAVAAIIVTWLLLPANTTWFLLVVAVPGALVGSRLGQRLPAKAVRRAVEQRAAQLPTALDLLATCLAAGLPLSGATSAVRDAMSGPVRTDLSRVLQHLDIGATEAEAWRALADVPAWRAVARDIARAAGSGTGLVEVLTRAAAEAREIRYAELLARARTAGVRSVLPLMTCFLPAFLLLGIVPIVGAAVVQLIP